MSEKNAAESAGQTKHANLRLPMSLYQKIEALAQNNERTVSGQIRYMLQEYIRIKES